MFFIHKYDVNDKNEYLYINYSKMSTQNKRINQFSTDVMLTGHELILIMCSGFTKNMELANVKDFVLSGQTILSNLGFSVTPDVINQDIELPDNSTVYFNGNLEMGSGYTLTIPTGTTLVILDDSTNLIYTDVEANSMLIGGTGNTLNSSVFNSIVLGGVNITGTSDNTVYVPDLVIKKLATIPVNSVDTIGENGSVTWDNNYFYWKANDQWLRLSGLTF
jgi:hypothetical protein